MKEKGFEKYTDYKGKTFYQCKECFFCDGEHKKDCTIGKEEMLIKNKINIKINMGKNGEYIKDITEILEPYKLTERDKKSLSEVISKIITSNKYVTLEVNKQ